jgi:hypothetical protein
MFAEASALTALVGVLVLLRSESFAAGGDLGFGVLFLVVAVASTIWTLLVYGCWYKLGWLPRPRGDDSSTVRSAKGTIHVVGTVSIWAFAAATAVFYVFAGWSLFWALLG